MPSFLHRVFTRCTMPQDAKHHIQFLKTILKHRNQNMKVVEGKFESYFSKRRQPRTRAKAARTRAKAARTRSILNLKFDAVSKMHLFTQKCILSSYKASSTAKPRIVYSSLPRVMSRISTKRKVLSIVKKQCVISD